MNDEKHAELARKEYSEFLRKSGAHAISVEEVPSGGRKTYAVIAMFESDPKSKLPPSLSVKTGTGEVHVPLITRKAERFKLD